ncbi:MAG: transposase [Cyanobacteria bacterium J06632_19]
MSQCALFFLDFITFYCIFSILSTEEPKLKEKSKTEDVSDYFAQLSQDCVQEGYNKLTIILDNNSTHKDKMKSQVKKHLENLEIENQINVDFIHTPVYSPNFNLVEYIIHLLRLNIYKYLQIIFFLKKQNESSDLNKLVLH